MLQLLIKILNFTCNPSALFLFKGVKSELIEVLAGICSIMGEFIFFLFKSQI